MNWGQIRGKVSVAVQKAGSNCLGQQSIDVNLDALPVPRIINFALLYCESTTSVILEPRVDTIPNSQSSFILTKEGDQENLSRFITQNNELNLESLDKGKKYTLSYRYTNDKGCTGTSVPHVFEIRGTPNTAFDFVNSARRYCESENSIVLDPEIPGGYFTIRKPDSDFADIEMAKNDNIINIADLDSIKAGTYNISYTITIGGCTGTSQEKTFVIVALPQLSIADINNNRYCVKDTSVVTLIPHVSGTPNNEDLDSNKNYFRIKRISGERGASVDFVDLTLPDLTTLTKVFDPSRPMPGEAAIGANATTEEWNEIVGEYLIQYIHQDRFGCRNTVEKKVEIIRLPKLSFTGLNDSYCDNAGLVTLTPFDGESKISSGVVFKYRKLTETTFHSFPQGYSFNTQNPAFEPGEYEIVLESDGSGCNNASNRDSTVTMTIKTTPKNIRVIASRDYNKSEVQFSVTVDNKNDGWRWKWVFWRRNISGHTKPEKNTGESYTTSNKLYTYAYYRRTMQ